MPYFKKKFDALIPSSYMASRRRPWVRALYIGMTHGVQMSRFLRKGAIAPANPLFVTSNTSGTLVFFDVNL